MPRGERYGLPETAQTSVALLGSHKGGRFLAPLGKRPKEITAIGGSGANAPVPTLHNPPSPPPHPPHTDEQSMVTQETEHCTLVVLRSDQSASMGHPAPARVLEGVLWSTNGSMSPPLASPYVPQPHPLCLLSAFEYADQLSFPFVPLRSIPQRPLGWTTSGALLPLPPVVNSVENTLQTSLSGSLWE